MQRRIPDWALILALVVVLGTGWIALGGALADLGGLHDPSHCGGG